MQDIPKNLIMVILPHLDEEEWVVFFSKLNPT